MVKTNIKRNAYYCVQDFVNDLELMWSNAIDYYTPSKEEFGSCPTTAS